MSSDLIVSLPIPLTPLLDRWQLAYRDRGGVGDFDREALDRIRFGGTYTGFFPIGESGCELYVQLTDPESAATDPVPGVPIVRCKALFSMHGDEWPLGLLAAEALAAAADGALYDPQEGRYLRVGTRGSTAAAASADTAIPPPTRRVVRSDLWQSLLWAAFFGLVALFLLLVRFDRGPLSGPPPVCAPLYDLLGPVGSALIPAAISAWFGWMAWRARPR